MTTWEEHFAVGRAIADRYAALEQRIGTDWSTGTRQLARSLLLSIAARYRAAIKAGHPHAAGLQWSVQELESWAEDHAMWIALELTSPTPG